MHPDVRIAKIAGRQRQLFTTQQALSVDLSPSAIKRRLARGLWIPLHRGVYILAGVPIGLEQQLMAAYLACAPRAAISCLPAAAIWGLITCSPPVHITVPTGRIREHDGITVHRSVELDVVTYRGFRVTHPMRTLLDVAAYVEEETLEVAIDDSLRRGLVHPDRFTAYLSLSRNREKTGSGVVRRFVALRKDGPTDSGGETKLFRFLRRYRLPLPVLQHPVEARKGVRYIDFAYPEHKVALEFDSWEWHSSRLAFDNERARRNELEELGWHVLQITSTQIREEPGVLASTVGTTLGLAPTGWKAI